ncbi:MAG: GMP/IMP nucleotidase [Desulfocapsaceae bacterium]|nr:GMP/IMP nucleotidase [Desulfocapsaceae bacterium]
MNKPTNQTAFKAVDILWDDIDTVMLDMDGTLLDKYFDDYFWEKYVPQVYGRKHNLSPEQAEEALLAKYRSVESTLQWTDLHYWTKRLGLDIIALKQEIDHLIGVHDHVVDFLQHIRSTQKKLCLITNAHPKTLEIKLAKTGIGHFFEVMICADEIGFAKEQVEFWHGLEKILSYDKRRALFADDTEKVLRAANQYGMGHLLHIAKPSSQLPTRHSGDFPSVAHFGEIILP